MGSQNLAEQVIEWGVSVSLTVSQLQVKYACKMQIQVIFNENWKNAFPLFLFS